MPDISTHSTAKTRPVTQRSMLDAITAMARMQLRKPVTVQRLTDALGETGQAVLAGRTALFEFHQSATDLVLLPAGEWCAPGVAAASNGALLRNAPLAELGLSRWRSEFERGAVLFGEHDDFPPPERNFFEQRGCNGIAAVPIHVGEELWGFLACEYFAHPLPRVDGIDAFFRAAAAILGSMVASGRLTQHLERINTELYEIRVMRDNMAGELDDIKEWKGQVFSSFAHEFQTPLYTLLGFSATLLENEELDEDKEIRHTCLRHIHEQSMRLEKLVTEMMTASRLQSRNYPLRVQEMDIIALLHDLEPMLRATTDRAGVELILDLPADAVALQADQTLLRQLFVNLVESSLATTPAEGWISITVASDAGNVIATVTDSGTGIPPERLGHVFEPFSQYTSLPSTAAGAGLGLSIARDIVDLHHGFITADSKVGEGTTFTVVLPRSAS